MQNNAFCFPLIDGSLSVSVLTNRLLKQIVVFARSDNLSLLINLANFYYLNLSRFALIL